MLFYFILLCLMLDFSFKSLEQMCRSHSLQITCVQRFLYLNKKQKRKISVQTSLLCCQLCQWFELSSHLPSFILLNTIRSH